MARHLSPGAIPKNIPTWEYNAWRRVFDALASNDTALAAVARGEVPDGSGDPIASNPDLSLFFYLPGRVGNQSGAGGTLAAGTLTLTSTAHATKGFLYLGEAQDQVIFDETQNLLGLNIIPAATLHVKGSVVGGAGSVILPNSDLNANWGSPLRDNGVPIAGTFATALSSNDDLTSYGAMDVGGPSSIGHGTNPQWCGLDTAIQPGATYSVTVRIAALFVNPETPYSFLQIRIVDSNGDEWNQTEATSQDVDQITDHDVFHTATRTVVCSGTPTATGQTANSVKIYTGMQNGGGLAGVYCATSYVAISLNAADILRWDLYDGTRSGRVDLAGRMGVGTDDDALSARLTLKMTSAGEVGTIIKGASSQSANLLEFQNSSATLLSRVTSAGVWDGPVVTTSAVTVTDNVFSILDNATPSKILQFQLSGIASSTTRTWTVGNYSGIPAVPTDEGTSGFFLKSAGAAAQPVWDIARLFGFALTSDDNVNNSTAETDISNAGGVGSLSVNGAVAGTTVRVTGSGTIGNIINDTIQLRLKHGATTVLDTGAFNLGFTTTNWRFVIDLTWRSTTTVSANGWVEILDSSTGTMTYLPWSANAATVSTTGDISLTAQWSGGGAPSASDTITTTNFTVETIR